MISRYGSHALARGLRAGGGGQVAESVITCMAGFEPDEPVITSMAAFGGGWPHRPGVRISTPAAFRYRLAVSRRTPVAVAMRRRLQPSRPSARICCRFSRSKTFAITTEAKRPRQGQCPGRDLALWPLFSTALALGQETSGRNRTGVHWVVHPKAEAESPLVARPRFSAWPMGCRANIIGDTHRVIPFRRMHPSTHPCLRMLLSIPSQ